MAAIDSIFLLAEQICTSSNAARIALVPSLRTG